MMQHVFTHKECRYHGELYRIVFECIYVKLAIAFLFAAFLLQPVAPAFADEIVESDAPEAADQVEEPEPEPEHDPEPEPDIVESNDEVVDQAEEKEVETATENDDSADESKSDEDTVLESTQSENDQVEIIDVQDEEVDTPNADETGDEVETNIEPTRASSSIESDSASDTDQVASSSVETSVEGAATASSSVSSSTPTLNNPDNSDTGVSDDIIDDTSTSSATTSASTTSENQTEEDSDLDEDKDEADIVDEKPESSDVASTTEGDNVAEGDSSQATTIVQFNSDQNKYQFSDTECVSVGDGSFYCSKQELSDATPIEGVVEARADNEGDREIYILIGKDNRQLTDNQLEDFAPFYDQVSNSVVWHRLENGRYEVMSYDLVLEEETVITNNEVNDMEPTRAGKYIVWQRWVDDNWEIVLFDGEEERQITNSATHDVAPNIKDDYVIWNTNDAATGERLVMVYEIATGLISTINDAEGGLVENPRFVLVYDTTYDNGDVVTKGYDFESGEVVPLAAVPRPIPTEIPEPDSTGEIRALIQTKSSNNEEEIIESRPRSASSTKQSTSTVSSVDDLAIEGDILTENESQAATALDLSSEETEPLPLTDFDLIIEPYFEASSTQQIDSETASSSVE